MTDFYDMETRRQTIVTSVVLLIAQGGMDAVTIRAIAEHARVAPSGLDYTLGNREQILAESAGDFGHRLLRSFDPRSGAHALLPPIDGELLPTRVWLTFRELALSHPAVADEVAEVDRRERGFLDEVLPPEATKRAVVEIHAVVLGLRDAICRTVDPMPLVDAHRALTTQVENAARPAA
jgi:AcrR family transcriptional regulator